MRAESRPEAATALATADLLDLVRPDLERVEATLDREITSEVRVVGAVGEHILLAGGKRLRPAMVEIGRAHV